MGNKRTATITWLKYYNFGTFLQAYALQQSIINLGYENHILDDASIPKPKQSVVNTIKGLILKMLPWDPRSSYRALAAASKKSDDLYKLFLQNNLIVDTASAGNQTSADTYYDQYVCGSDQIWCPILEERLNKYYYAGFTKKKRIAYAASFGVKEYPEQYIEEFKELVSDFSAISCREKIGCQFIKQILKRESTYVVDPTLLLTGDDWRKIASPRTVKEKYILCYFLTSNSWYLEFARSYAEKFGLKLVTFFLRPSSPQEADVALSAGPSEFISLIDNAELLLTDSFHGSIFATHLSTPFIGFRRFTGSKEGQNNRLTDLYSLMGISERFILDGDDCKRIPSLKEQDFSQMVESLQPLVETSINFLKQSLAE